MLAEANFDYLACGTMWKSQAGIVSSKSKATAADDDADEDWETEATYENTLDEKAKRLGGTQHQCVDMQSLRQQVQTGDQDRIAKAEKSYKHGFGGAFGIQKDRQDKSAANWEYKADIVQHSSQKTDKPQLKEKSESVVSAMDRINKQISQEQAAKPASNTGTRSSGVTARIAEAKQRFSATDMPSSTDKEHAKPRAAATAVQIRAAAMEVPIETSDNFNNSSSSTTNSSSVAVDANAQQSTDHYAEVPLISASAVYDYQKTADDEIDLEPGDIILNIRKLDEGWWYGENAKTGQTGLFPANYVQEQ